MRRPIAFVASVLIALLIVQLAACGGGGGGGSADNTAPASNIVQELRPLQADGVGSVTTATLYSPQTGSAYNLDIYVPASYAGGTQSYPVIYATDGDALYPPVRRFDNFKSILQRRGTDAILVGIGDTRNRSRDMVLPGALAYHAFIVQDLVLFIEARLRADPKRRVLSGLSLGGSFVASALFIEAPTAPLFSHYLSAEGTFSQPSFQQQEQQLSDTIGSKSIPATLFLIGSSLGGTTTNGLVVEALYQKMLARRYVGLQLVSAAYPFDHVGVDNPSFEDAVIRIFEPPR